MIREVPRAVIGAVPAAVWVLLAVLLIPVVVAWATASGMLTLVAFASLAVAGLVAALVRPLPVLLVYVAFIPVEALFVLGELGTVARAAGAVFFAGYLLRRLGRIDLGAMPLLGWAFVAWAALSVTWAIDPGTALSQLATLAQLAIITVVIADLVAERPEVVPTILWTYTATATVVALVAVAAVVAGGEIGDERASAFSAQGPAHLTAVLLPAFFHLAFELTRVRRRALVGSALVVVVAAILLSGTRSAWLAVAVMMLVAVVPRLGARALVPGALVGLALLAAVQIPEVGALYADRIASALETGGAGRVDIWSVGLTIFARNPLIGVGYENFPVAFTPEVIRSAEVPGLNLGILVPGVAPHSIVIGTLTELGVVGATLLAGFLAVVLFRPAAAPWGGLLKVILGALLFQALFLDLLGRKQLWLVIGLLLGLAVAERRRRRRRAEDAAEERERFASRIRHTWSPEP
jgi:O-antigen ligase